MAQKRKAPEEETEKVDLVEFGQEKDHRRKRGSPVQITKNEMSQLINRGLELYSLPAIDLTDPVAIGDRMVEYFQICQKNGDKLSVPGLILALGTNKQEFNAMLHDSKGVEVADVLKKANTLLNYATEHYMLDGKINPVVGIFFEKNHFGYRDQQDVILTPHNPLGDITDRKELEKRYLDSMPDVIEGTAAEVAESAESAESTEGA